MKSVVFISFLVFSFLTASLLTYGQEVKSKAMTKEEILKELEKSTNILKGKISYSNKIIGAFDSEKGSGSETSFLKPSEVEKWRKIKNQKPTLNVELLKGNNPNDLLLVTNSKIVDKKLMIWQSHIKNKNMFTLNFAESISNGCYEFAVMKGEMIIFLGCGFVIE